MSFSKCPKVLINVPHMSLPGGVTSLFNILKLNASDNIDYFEISKPGKVGKIKRLFELVTIYFRFAYMIAKYDAVHLNPSLNSKSFYRDAVFVMIARLYKRKVLVYWHGWENSFEEKIKSNPVTKWIFNKSYKVADTSIVLGSVFRKKLIALGCKNNVLIESNAASSEYINIAIQPKKLTNGPIIILFIARIEIEKGIYIAIDTVDKLSERFPVKLIIGGDGSELPNVKKYVAEKGIKNIEFAGYVKGQTKHDLLTEADIFLFPTYYPEGMPISIIEAMLYGLPVVTSDVGGIPDWVTPENGFVIKSGKTSDYIIAMENMLINPDMIGAISKNNLEKAELLFTVPVITKRLNLVYKNLFDND